MILQQQLWTGLCICWVRTLRCTEKFNKSFRRFSVTVTCPHPRHHTPSHFHDIIYFPAWRPFDSSVLRLICSVQVEGSLYEGISCENPCQNKWRIIELFLPLCRFTMTSIHFFHDVNWSLVLTDQFESFLQSKHVLKLFLLYKAGVYLSINAYSIKKIAVKTLELMSYQIIMTHMVCHLKNVVLWNTSSLYRPGKVEKM